MGAFTTNFIQSTGDDRSFLTLVYNFIMGLDEGITSSITPSEFSYASKTICNMDFTLEEGVVLRLQSYPGDNLAQPVSCGYNFALIINNNTIMNKGLDYYSTTSNSPIRFIGSNVNVWNSATRAYVVSKYDSDNVKIFWIGPYDSVDYTSAGGIAVIKFKDSNNVWHYGGYTGPSIDSASITDSSGASIVSKSSIFDYAALPGYIDYIRESGYVSGGTKIFTSTDIFDCSTVELGSTITLSDGNYMAIGPHSLIKV